MTETLSCPECGAEAESIDELDVEHDVPEVDVADDGSFNLFGNRDLFLCKNCKNALGMAHKEN